MDDRAAGAAPHIGHAVLPVWKYLAVYAALLALTTTTVAAAYVDLGPMNNVVAVGIAGLKALLVVLYFMHVRWSGRLIPLVAFAGFLWLIYLIAGTLADYLTRGMLGVPGK
jgi:cytochrome c oxidase subunit 4